MEPISMILTMQEMYLEVSKYPKICNSLSKPIFDNKI